MICVTQRIIAPNDRNGNPRRGWQVCSLSDDGYASYAFIDEGYEGDQALYNQFPADTRFLHMLSIEVSASQYGRLLQ